MAHEINNPLSVIRAGSEYIREAGEKYQDAELRAIAEDLELAVERIRAFIEHVSGLARLDRGELIELPLLVAIEGALRRIGPRLQARAVELLVEGDLSASVAQDPKRLSQAIQNLLSNAVDAATEIGRHVTLWVGTEEQTVVIRIDDDGAGIDSAIESSLFEPFVTTKRPDLGIGLGLAITRQIIGEHGGEVRLLPREKGGTRAEVVLPKPPPKAT